MSKISEFFGLYCKNPSTDFRNAMAEQICPYTQRICTKMRKSDPEIKIGTCSVKYQNDGIEGVRLGDPVHIHSYNFEENENKLTLSLHTRISTDSEGIANCLHLNAESKVELQELIHILEPKLTEANRLKVRISG